MFLGRPHTCKEGTEMCWGSCSWNQSVFDERLYNLTSDGDCVCWWLNSNSRKQWGENAWGFFHQSCCFSKKLIEFVSITDKVPDRVFSLPLHEWFSLWMVYLWMVARKTSLLLAKGEVSGAQHASSHFQVPLDFVEIVLCWLMPGKSDICFWQGCSFWLFSVRGQALMEAAVGTLLRQTNVAFMLQSGHFGPIQWLNVV